MGSQSPLPRGLHFVVGLGLLAMGFLLMMRLTGNEHDATLRAGPPPSISPTTTPVPDQLPPQDAPDQLPPPSDGRNGRGGFGDEETGDPGHQSDEGVGSPPTTARDDDEPPPRAVTPTLPVEATLSAVGIAGFAMAVLHRSTSRRRHAAAT